MRVPPSSRITLNDWRQNVSRLQSSFSSFELDPDKCRRIDLPLVDKRNSWIDKRMVIHVRKACP
jgi:hypothetical protein